MSPLFFSSRSYIYKKFSMSPVHCQIRRLPLNLPGPVAVNLRHAVCWRLGDCCTYIVNPEIVHPIYNCLNNQRVWPVSLRFIPRKRRK